MAIQKGHIKYTGTLGEVRHFRMKGLPEYYAGLKGGPTGEQVFNDSVFERTRENMNEFGGCAFAGKSVRVGLAQLMKQMSDPQLTGRLTAIMKKINLEDKSEARGYRAILITAEPQYLAGLDFDRNVSFNGIFYATFTLAKTEDRTGATLTVPVFNPLAYISAPAGATHFRLINAVSVISDFAYNDQSNVYEPVDPALNELSTIQYSDYISLSEATPDVVTVEATLTGKPKMNENVSVLNCIGIEFYQEVNKNFYLFNSGNALKIEAIF